MKNAAKKPMVEIYEIASMSFNDISLDQQIAFGINDWQCDVDGRAYFGRSKQEALDNAGVAE